MVDYIFQSTEINMMKWLVMIPCFSRKSIAIFTFNMLLDSEQSFFTSPKDLILIYLWALL